MFAPARPRPKPSQLESPSDLSTQREDDPESGLMHYRARSYDPRVGRFVQKDPPVARRALHHYTYASNGPTTNTDPLGLFELGYHDEATDFALREGAPNFTASARQIVSYFNIRTDLETYFAEKMLLNPLQGAGAGGPVPTVQIDKVGNLHFDSLKDAQSIDTAWKTLEANTQRAIKSVFEGAREFSPDMNYKILQILGQSLHAVQDFYSHSTWVNMAVDSGLVGHEIQTYIATNGTYAPVDRAKLFTGNHPSQKSDLRSHDRINKDSPVDTEENKTRSIYHSHALRVAKTASVEWVRKVREWTNSSTPGHLALEAMRTQIERTTNDSVAASYPLIIAGATKLGIWRQD